MSKMTSPTVVLRELGKVRYREALALQQSLANKYKTAQPPQVKCGDTDVITYTATIVEQHYTLFNAHLFHLKRPSSSRL